MAIMKNNEKRNMKKYGSEISAAAKAIMAK
jgi:hypothetical protein